MILAIFLHQLFSAKISPNLKLKNNMLYFEFL